MTSPMARVMTTLYERDLQGDHEPLHQGPPDQLAVDDAVEVAGHAVPLPVVPHAHRAGDRQPQQRAGEHAELDGVEPRRVPPRTAAGELRRWDGNRRSARGLVDPPKTRFPVAAGFPRRFRSWRAAAGQAGINRSAMFRPAVGGGSVLFSLWAISSHSSTISHSSRYTPTSSSPWQQGPTTPGHQPTKHRSSSDHSTILMYLAPAVIGEIPRSFLRLPSPDRALASSPGLPETVTRIPGDVHGCDDSPFPPRSTKPALSRSRINALYLSWHGRCGSGSGSRAA